ncbi:MAG: cytochrome c [Pseudomonadota bacterium]|nr:cytochrome c [Pseudomonadota bacterium]
MKKRFNFKVTAVLSTAVLGSALFLAGCSGDTEEPKTASAPAAEQNTMDVKQPAPVAAPKATLQPAPEPVAEIPAAVEEKVAEVKEVVAAAVAPSGEKAYATCVGCHGARGEGGVGPRLNNQTVADVIAKLEKYKAGEQVGPMTGMMAPMAAGLSADDMKVIAEYVTTL